MQDLQQIISNNAKAAEQQILASRDAGRFGLAKYTGLHFQSFADFETEAERNAAATEWTNSAPTHRTVLHNPARATA